MQRSIGYLGLTLLALLWGTFVPTLTHLLQRWDPYFLAAFRYVGAIPFLWLAYFLVEKKRDGFAASFFGRRIWVLGIIGTGGYSTLFTVGVLYCNPVTAAILASTSPAIAAIVDRLFFAVPFDRRMTPAIILAIVGASLATIDFSGAGAWFDVRGGEFLIILSIGCWAWYSTAAQRWFQHWSQLRITAASITTGGVGLVPIYLTAAALGQAQFPPAAPEGVSDILILLWVVAVLVAFGVVLWNFGVKRAGIVVASLYLNLTPIVAIGIFAIGGKLPSIAQIAGGLLVIVGVVLSELRMLKSRRPDPALNAAHLS